MKYMGSKARHAKEMLPIILKDRKEGQWYVEPFVGGCNMIDKVDGNRIGADVNEPLISMWKSLQNGWTPPEYTTPSTYKSIRESQTTCRKDVLGWIGHCCSYNGKWFGGFAGKITTKEGNERNYQAEAINAVTKQQVKLVGVQFHCCTYDALEFPSNSIIYCDPPYKGTTKYKDDFNHDKFYDWCHEKRKEGHTVFVSEYWMPDDFTCVWQKEVNSSLTKDTGSKKAVEKLFTLT